MSHPPQLTEVDISCVLDALCCLCVADNRISRGEFSVVLEAIKAAGVRGSDYELRTIVEARCRAIHKAGIRKSAEATIAAVRNAGTPQLGDLICRLQATALSTDGRVTDRESEVARLFRDAFHAETRCQAATPPGGQATEPEIRQRPDAVGESRAPLWIIGLLTVTLLFFGTLIAFGVRDATRHSQQMQINAANREIQAAVEKAYEWVQTGRLADADRIERLLLDATQTPFADNRDLLDPALASVREAKGRQLAAALLSKAQRAIAGRDLATAKTLLNQYIAHASVTAAQRTNAETLIQDIATATSDADALRTLLDMDDAAFADAAASGVFEGVVLGHPTLSDIYIDTLTTQMPEATRQRSAQHLEEAEERITKNKLRQLRFPDWEGIEWGPRLTERLRLVEHQQSPPSRDEGSDTYALSSEGFTCFGRKPAVVHCTFKEGSLQTLSVAFHEQHGLLRDLYQLLGGKPETFTGAKNWASPNYNVFFLGNDHGASLVVLSKRDAQQEAAKSEEDAKQLLELREYIAQAIANELIPQRPAHVKAEEVGSWPGLKGIDWGSLPAGDMIKVGVGQDGTEWMSRPKETKLFGRHEASTLKYGYKNNSLKQVHVTFSKQPDLLDGFIELMGDRLKSASGDRFSLWWSPRFGYCEYFELQDKAWLWFREVPAH